MPRADHQHIRAERGKGAAAHRPRDDTGQIKHADADRARDPAPGGSGGASPILTISRRGSVATSAP